jgi:hypothetical protein
MTMTGTRHCVTTVKIEITVAVTRVDPNALATLSGDLHLLVSRKLKLFLACGNV